MFACFNNTAPATFTTTLDDGYSSSETVCLSLGTYTVLVTEGDCPSCVNWMMSPLQGQAKAIRPLEVKGQTADTCGTYGGGALYLTGSQYVINGTVFNGTRTSSKGGAISMVSASVTNKVRVSLTPAPTLLRSSASASRYGVSIASTSSWLALKRSSYSLARGPAAASLVEPASTPANKRRLCAGLGA